MKTIITLIGILIIFSIMDVPSEASTIDSNELSISDSENKTPIEETPESDTKKFWNLAVAVGVMIIVVGILGTDEEIILLGLVIIFIRLIVYLI